MKLRRASLPGPAWKHVAYPSWAPLALIFIVAMYIVYRGHPLDSMHPVETLDAVAERTTLEVGRKPLDESEISSTSPGSSSSRPVSKFVLSADELTPQVEKEKLAFDDMIFIEERTTYKSILLKTYYILEYAVTMFDPKFILKTDDDAFVNIPPLVAELRQLCEHPSCDNERVYLGRMVRKSEVILTDGHKWNNVQFMEHTGLSTYPIYAMGGGYIVSGDVARILVDMNQDVHLKFTPIEDATLGMWLAPLDIRKIDHEKFWTWAVPCCFRAPLRRAGRRIVTRFRLREKFERGLCSEDPWLILHKIDSPSKMRYVGQKARNCTREWDGLVPSLNDYYPPHSLERYLAKNKSVQNARHVHASEEEEEED